MNALGPRQSLLIAAASLVAALTFTGYELFQYEHLLRDLSAQRRDSALARLHPVPVAVAAGKRAPAPRERTPTTDRLDELIKKAPKVMGGIPLVYPEDLFVDHPALERAFLEAKNGNVRLKYGPFFALAGLDEREIEDFCRIYADSEARWAELNRLAFERGVPRSDAAIKEMERKSSEERKTRLAALLGDERSAKLAAYQDEDGGRQMLLGLKNLIATTYYTPNPVTPEQINTLTAITTELGIFSPDKTAENPEAFDQAAKRAGQILTPEQLEIFHLILDTQHVSMLWFKERKAAGPDR